MEENVQKISDHIEDLILNLATDKLNPGKLFTLTVQSIEYLETDYPELSGSEKKRLLIEAFKDILSLTKHLSLNPSFKTDINDFVTNDIDIVIDSVIQVSKNEFRINEKQINCLIKYCKKFFISCLKKKNNSERP